MAAIMAVLNGGSMEVALPGSKSAEETRRAQIITAAYEVACERGLEGLTVRRVADAAGLSHGLVHFHFKTKAALLSALLDQVLARTTSAQVQPEQGTLVSPLERLLGLVRHELVRLTRDRRHIRLFFDFWILGTRHLDIRAKLRAELHRYRETFRALAEEVVQLEPDRFRGITAAGMAAIAVAFVKGCAVQSVIDPRAFEVDEVTKAVDGLLSEPRIPSRRSM
jgi:AcrR family transcriptional regulator